MGHLTRRTTTADYPLTLPQRLELEMGPKGEGAFEDEDDLRRAWQANRDDLLAHYAFGLHDAGWRPMAFWFFEAGDRDLVEDDLRADGRCEPARLRWLADHDAFLPGELEVIERRARAEPGGYAAAAWRVLKP